MAGDGLFDPLGVGHAEPVRLGRRPSAPVLMAAICLAAASLLVAIAWWRDDGNRGRPLAVVPIEHVMAPPKPPLPQPTPPQPVPALSASPEAAAVPGLPSSADQEFEIQNGVRIVRPRRDRSAVPSQALPVPSGTLAPSR